MTVLLDIHPNAALVLAVIPPAVFLGISFKIKSDTQILIAAVMSVLYAFHMMNSALTLIGVLATNTTKPVNTKRFTASHFPSDCFFSHPTVSMVREGTIMTPSGIFIITLACFYIVTALLHPQEAGLIVYGFLYILCIPSAYLLLAIYSMVNMNNVSWGTRETAPAPGTATPAAQAPQTQTQKGKY